jgi:hypothetical protein
MSAPDETQAGNVLVMAESMSDAKTETCYHLLGVADPGDVDLLRVVYHRTPDRLLDEWEHHLGSQPANTVIVGVDDRVQSGAIASSESGPDAPDLEVLTANPNDLTGLGMELNNALTALSRTDNDVYVCFDSVTALLQFVDTESAYKFLHMFTGQLHQVDARAHFHMDPEAHETRTVSRLKTTFDDMRRVGE